MVEFNYKRVYRTYLVILALISIQYIKPLDSIAERNDNRNFEINKNSAQEYEKANRAYITGIVRKLTVRITRDKSNSSGVLISRKGNIYEVITAWHAVNDSEKFGSIKIITHDMKIHTISKKDINKIPFVDMAILKFRSLDQYETAMIGNEAEISMGTKITTGGYIDKKLNITNGRIIANSRLKTQEGLQIIYTNKIIPGMSGGPIIDNKGKLIGINGTTNHHLIEDIEGGGYAKGIPVSYYYNKISDTDKLSRIDDYIVRAEDMISQKENSEKIIEHLNYANKNLSTVNYRQTKEFIYRKLCELKTISKDYIGAISECSKLIELKPNESYAYTNRCSAYAYLEKIDRAYLDCNKSIEINPKNAQAYTNLCFIGYISKEYRKAKLNCDKAVEIDNSFDQAFSNRCAINIHLKKIYKAEMDCKKALDINNSNALAYTNLCYLNFRIGKNKEALTYCNNAIEIDSNIDTAYLNRCAIKLTLGDNLGAIDDCKMSKNINPNSAQLYANTCLALLNIGETIKAKSKCEKALEINPEMINAIINLTVINIEIKDYIKAIYYANKAIEINEEYRIAYINRGIAKYYLNNKKDACIDWFKAQSLGAKKVDNLINLGCNTYIE